MGVKMTSADSAESPTIVKSASGTDKDMVVVTPDFRLSLTVASLGLYMLMAQATGFGMIVSFIGAFLVLQTIRLRFRFGGESLDVLRVEQLSDEGKRSEPAETDPAGRKVAIGPWKYSSVVNWEFWWPGFPVVAYFKETQTKATGQRHFFFMIMDGKAVYGEMLKRFGNAGNAKPGLDEWDDLRPLSPKGYARVKAKAWKALLHLEQQLQIKTRIETAIRMVKSVRADDVAVTLQKVLKLARLSVVKAVRGAKELLAKATSGTATIKSKR